MEKRNKKVILISVVIVLSVAALFYFYDFLKEGRNDISNVSDTQEPAAGNTIVEITNEGYNPQTVVIKKGAVVTWVNKGDQTHTVSSDPHPTHTDLPGLTSNPMQPNQSFSFAFEQTGSFGYHCHFHPNVKGRVIVKD
jgi:plastocyanin